MQLVSEARVDLGSEPDIVRARQLVRKLAQDTRFSLVDQTKLVTAASELARNTVKHGGGGYMDMQLLADGGRRERPDPPAQRGRGHLLVQPQRSA